MNPKKKPDYNPEEVLQSLVDTAVEIYTENNSLRSVAEKMDINVIKARKLLITAKYQGISNVYQSGTAEKIKLLQQEGKTIAEIMKATGLSNSSVNSYLPYTKVPYKAKELSINAERIRIYRERKAACEKLAEKGSFPNLWAALVAFQGYLFRTSDGIKFRYEIKDGDMVIICEESFLMTRSSMEMAYKRTLEGGPSVTERPGVFGTPYLLPVFVRLGVIRQN